MPDLLLLRPGSKSPTLFQQIAFRLALLVLIYVFLNIVIVVATYSQQPESLAQELLNLEAKRIERSTPNTAGVHDGPPGASHWFVQYLTSPPGPAGASAPTSDQSLIDWTQRERLGDGFRISGIRTISKNGAQIWLYMKFEGNGLEPYVPVIVSEIIQHVALPLAPLSVLMLLFSIMAVRQVLHPLREAEREVNTLGGDTVKLRLTEHTSPREIHTMVRAINRALGRLDDAMDTLRTFTANAAHELRTPLSIMQLNIDRLTPGDIRTSLQKDVSYMARLVTQMLDLAHADALDIQDSSIVDLATVARDVVEALAPMAYRSGRELRLELLGPSIAIGHEEAVFRIMRNLIDNALTHAPTSQTIAIVVGSGPQFYVRDFGPGIPLSDRQYVFDRFWRSDRRASDGAGLGLGIVKRLAQAHGGQIIVEDPQGGGALFRVSLRAPASSKDPIPSQQG